MAASWADADARKITALIVVIECMKRKFGRLYVFASQLVGRLHNGAKFPIRHILNIH